MASYCETCGSRSVHLGICSNCQEELFIYKFQGEYQEEPLSAEFMEKVEQQRREVDHVN